MLPQARIVFPKRQLIRGVHGILLRIISTNPRFLRNETNELALCIAFLCHIERILAWKGIFFKGEIWFFDEAILAKAPPAMAASWGKCYNKPMKIIFVRHGETDRNVKERASEQIATDDETHHLNANGRKQAEQVAEQLKNEKVDAIFTSPYNRATETAEAIARYHKNAPVVKLKDLRERGGTLVGDLWHESFDFDKISEHADDPRFGSVEPVQELFERVYSAIEQIKDYGYQNVVVVSHGGVHHAFHAYFNNLEWKGNLRIDKMYNCDVRIYETKL